MLERHDTIQVPAIQGYNATGVIPNGNGNGNGADAFEVEVISRAALGLEYLASTGPRFLTQFGAPMGVNQGAGIHILPIYIDELERDFGTDMYRRMMNDACVKSADATLRDGILSKTLQILPGCKKEEKDEKLKTFADKVATFIRANLEGYPGSFQKVCREMLGAMAYGYKLAEKVYEVREIVPGNGPQTVLKSINTKPQEAVSIVADKYNDVLGYMPRLEAVGLYGSMVFGDLGVRTVEDSAPGTHEEMDIPGLVPPDKVWRFTWESENDSPVGTSHLRAAYIPWRLKIGLYPAYEAFLSRFAQPSVALELGGQDIPPMAGPDGRILKDPTAIVTMLLTNLRNFAAGGGMVLPAGKLNMLQATGAGQVYLSAFELVDQQITSSILFANLSTQGGKYGTQALGEVHQDTTDLLYAYGRLVFAANIREEVVKPLVLYNYGEEGLAVLPEVSFGETEQQDIATISSAISQVTAAGMIFPPQFNELLAMLNFPLIPEDVMNMLMEKMNASIAADITLAQNPMGPPVDPNAPGTDPNADPNAPPADPNAPNPDPNKPTPSDANQKYW